MQGNSSFLLVLKLAVLLCIAGCGMQLKETFVINSDLSGKCFIDAKMVVDTNKMDAKYAMRDSTYGIQSPIPNYHKDKFSRRDAMALALKILGTHGVEVWSNINYGMSKKRDVIYFRGTAYFRNIDHVHFTTFDSLLKVTKDGVGNVTFTVDEKPIGPGKQMMSDDELDKKANEIKKNAFYIRPVMADVLNPSQETVVYELPNTIMSSSVYDQQGDNYVQLKLTGNDVLKYADSVCKSTDLEKQHYKVTAGTNEGGIIDLFNKLVFGTSGNAMVQFKKGGKDQFDYNNEVQGAIAYYDEYMKSSGLQKFDSTRMMKEEREEAKAAEENGVLVVSKSDSEQHKPYFTELTVTQAGDTLQFEGQLSGDIKANADAKVHIVRLVDASETDIIDSLQDKNKLSGELSSTKGETTDKVQKRNVKFYTIVHFPKGCKEVEVQGRVSTMYNGKPGPQLSFKVKQIEIVPVKGK